MKKRRFFALFLVLCLLTSLLSVSASAFEEIDVDARAALLVENETGEILYEKNAHEKNYPASITKLTVALLVFEAIDAGQLSLDQPITAHESAFEGLSIYGSTAGIKVGEVLTVEQLLQCMLIVSANEACNILAEAVCGEGNISQFVQRMNERAAALGCENTHYVNTSGLHDPDHYTTAWDIYLITRALMPYEKFMEICNSKSAEIAETDHNQRHVLHSTNRLISNWRELGYLYRDAQGIKTGSTEEAGHCLVSSAVRGDRQLVSVVLGAEKITLADGKSTLTKSFSETIRLFDYGFDCFSRREVVSADELVREGPGRPFERGELRRRPPRREHYADAAHGAGPQRAHARHHAAGQRGRPHCRRRRAGRNDRLLQRHRLRHGQAARAQRCVSLVAAGRQARRGGLLLPHRRQNRSRRPCPAHSRIPFPARERARTALRQAQQRTRRSRRLSRPQALSIGKSKLLRSSNRTKRTGYPVRFPFSRENSAARGLLSLIFAHSPAILHSSSDKEALL